MVSMSVLMETIRGSDVTISDVHSRDHFFILFAHPSRVAEQNPTTWRSEFLALKKESSIFGHSSNPVCGFSMMKQVRLCAVWPMENWLGSSLNQIQGSYSRALEQGSLGPCPSRVSRSFNLRVPSNLVAMVSRKVFCGASSPFLPGILARSSVGRPSLLSTKNHRHHFYDDDLDDARLQEMIALSIM